ncbi:hypothetical protein IWX90DRAFT_308600 [Phyllosticta citrichinensis]|uniref:Rhodopsin domain-containing protein n=1 Tax=Phyllosticta citrichinensis TaxID=1130410 RepID=A0ABR1XLL2_9PEZI
MGNNLVTPSDNLEPIPLVNQQATILGVSVVFASLAVAAVVLRLYARFKMTHAAGWDDLLVSLAAISSVVGAGLLNVLPDHGLGQHLNTLSFYQIQDYLYWFWVAELSYICSTTLIKVSLLVQYLRLFTNQRVMIRIIVALIVFTSIWGLCFLGVSLFGCRPIHKFWRLLEKGHCVIGSGRSFFLTFLVHAATSMVLDFVVLSLPLFTLSRIDLQGARKFAVAGLVTLGAIVTIMNLVKVVLVVKTQAGFYPVTDPTFYAPPGLILSALEVDFAILCASIPVFWPAISKLGFGRIFVVNEVVVQTQQRLRGMSSSQFETDSEKGETKNGSYSYKDPFYETKIGGDIGVFSNHGDDIEHAVKIETTEVPMNHIRQLC